MATATATPTTAITKKAESLQSLLDKMKGQIAIALPRHMTAERMIRVALTAVQKTPALKQCTPMSIVGCIVQASQLGLEPDGVLGQSYLVPFKNRNTGQREAQLQIGYRGFITLARRSGEVSNVYSELVYECDEFNVQLGTEKKLHHVPDYEDVNRGAMDEETGALVGLKGAYAVVLYKDGATDFEYMPLYELNRIRFSSKAANDGPWVTHPAEMYKKCPIRRLAKRLPLSPELMKAAVHDEHVDAGVALATVNELVDIDEPIFQDTQDQRVAEKGQTTLNGIKQKYAARPQQPPQATENLDAEPAPESTVVAEARQVQAKIDQKRQQATTTTNSGKRPPAPVTESGLPMDESEW